VLADPQFRLHALVALFAGVAGIRLILAGVLQPTRRWSFIVVGILVFLILARPDFLGRASPTIFRASPAGHSVAPIAQGRDDPADALSRLGAPPAAVHDAVSAP
jgi:hypothetical protein